MHKSFHSVIQRHAHMIFDMERSLSLLRAIAKKVKPGDVVVDVGCGLGLLSFAACYKGAKRVYAMDVDGEALEFAQWQARRLGMGKKICFLEDHSFNVELIEKADVLIQETVGPLAFDENFIPTLEDAKKRFLKLNGKIIPAEVALYCAPSDRHKKLLQKPAPLFKIKTKNPLQKYAKGIHIKKRWSLSPGAEHFAGILAWPYVVWTKGCVTDCAPDKKPTHWGQTFFPVNKNQKVAATFWLNILPHPEDPLHYSEIEWKIGR